MDEKFVSGYCRQIDQARMVLAEYVYRDGEIQLDCVDCLYPQCEFARECALAQSFITNKTGDLI